MGRGTSQEVEGTTFLGKEQCVLVLRGERLPQPSCALSVEGHWISKTRYANKILKYQINQILPLRHCTVLNTVEAK